MSFAPVTLALLGKRAGEYADEPLDLWCVRAWEPHPPAGVEPLEWILLTNVAVADAADARERLSRYESRWAIEEYHKRLTTGCGIEKLPFDTVERLEPAIGILSALATTLLPLRDAARAPDADIRPAAEVIGPEYVEALTQRYPERLRGFVSIKKFYRHVARFGGHQNRTADGFPGWLTLWRGWLRLEDLANGYRLARRKQRIACGKTQALALSPEAGERGRSQNAQLRKAQARAFAE